MFGSRKKALKEELQEVKKHLQISGGIVADLADQKLHVEGCYSEMMESAGQLEAELGQISSNTDTTLEYAAQNADTEKILEQNIREVHQSVTDMAENSKKTLEQMKDQEGRWRQLLDAQKQYEEPAGYLNGFLSSMRDQNQEYLDQMDQMTRLGKDMGVLALTAAIEAGRMGETGKNFVEAAQKIRDQSFEYERIVASVKNKLEAEESRIQKLEEQAGILAGILKENNILETEMLKHFEETKETAAKASKDGVLEELAEMKERIAGLWNAEQEIVKVQKRNQIQLGDMKEEYQAWQEITDDAVQLIQPVMESATEYIWGKGEV